jgi:hypothetical protein
MFRLEIAVEYHDRSKRIDQSFATFADAEPCDSKVDRSGKLLQPFRLDALAGYQNPCWWIVDSGKMPVDPVRFCRRLHDFDQLAGWPIPN